MAHDATTGIPSGIPRSVIEILDSLQDLPGLLEAAVLSPRRGQVVGTAPADTGVGALLEWARRTHEVSIERGRQVEDVIVTSTRSLHVVRMAVVPGEGPVWVAVRVDLQHGTLAIVRRRLALLGRDALALPAGPSTEPFRRPPEALPPGGATRRAPEPRQAGPHPSFRRAAGPGTPVESRHGPPPIPAASAAPQAPPIPARLLGPAPSAPGMPVQETPATPTAPAPRTPPRASGPELVPALASLPPLPSAPPSPPVGAWARAAEMAALAASALTASERAGAATEPATDGRPAALEPAAAPPNLLFTEAPGKPLRAAASTAATGVDSDAASSPVPAPRRPWRPTALIEPFTVPPPELLPASETTETTDDAAVGAARTDPDATTRKAETPTADTTTADTTTADTTTPDDVPIAATETAETETDSTPDAEPSPSDPPGLPNRRPGAALPVGDTAGRAARRRPDESALKRVLVGLRRLA